MWYAQRGEDKKLRSFFPDKHDGFYIDVGAYHPEEDSVTKHFYDDGWSGINIEPIPCLYELFLKQRPRDTNLEMAMSDTYGTTEMTHIFGTGLSTIDRFIASTHADFTQEQILVKTGTLSGVCSFYAHNRPIDFLKIDVEGHERQVLLGMSFRAWRPEIMCIEATAPLSSTPNFAGWLPIVLQAGYEQIDFDGLNLWFRDKHA